MERKNKKEGKRSTAQERGETKHWREENEDQEKRGRERWP